MTKYNVWLDVSAFDGGFEADWEEWGQIKFPPGIEGRGIPYDGFVLHAGHPHHRQELWVVTASSLERARKLVHAEINRAISCIFADRDNGAWPQVVKVEAA